MSMQLILAILTKRYINDIALSMLVRASITSRLDYCNTLLLAGSGVIVRRPLQQNPDVLSSYDLLCI